jgi:hypothetical protein
MVCTPKIVPHQFYWKIGQFSLKKFYFQNLDFFKIERFIQFIDQFLIGFLFKIQILIENSKLIIFSVCWPVFLVYRSFFLILGFLKFFKICFLIITDHCFLTDKTGIGFGRYFHPSLEEKGVDQDDPIPPQFLRLAAPLPPSCRLQRCVPTPGPQLEPYFTGSNLPTRPASAPPPSSPPPSPALASLSALRSPVPAAPPPRTPQRLPGFRSAVSGSLPPATPRWPRPLLGCPVASVVAPLRPRLGGVRSVRTWGLV